MKKKITSILLVFILLGVLLSGCSKVQYTWDSGTAYAVQGTGTDASQNYFVFTNATSILKLNVDKDNLTLFYPEKASANRQFHAAPEIVDIDAGNDIQIIEGDYATMLESISFKDATPNWQFNKAAGRYIASSITVGHTVIAANTDGFIYFIDLAKPEDKSRWEIASVRSYPEKSAKNKSLDASGVASADLATFWATKANVGLDKNALNAFWSTPATDGTTVYAPNMDHFVYAVDIATGKDKWSKLDLGGAIVADPLLVDGVLYVGTLKNEFYAIDTATGKVKSSWPVKLDGSVWSKPVYKDGKLYIGDGAGMISIIDAQTGAIIDTYDTQSSVLGSGVDIGDKILFGVSNGSIVSVDADNVFDNWGDKVVGELNSNLVFDGQYVLALVQNGDQAFYVFDLDGNTVQIDTAAIK